MIDRSNGYEGVAREFLARRGSGRSTGVGVNAVRQWAQELPHGAAAIDLGCDPGFPITEVLVAEGLNVFAVDAAPSFVKAFRSNLPDTPVVCEAVQDSAFFGRTFDAVLAWGLIFLLSPDDQRHLIHKDRRHIGARWPAAIYILCGCRAVGLGRCDDRIRVTILLELRSTAGSFRRSASPSLVSTRMRAKTTTTMFVRTSVA